MRDPNRAHAGVVLTGIGGVGKSAVAGRAMQRLAAEGWLVPAHTGRLDLGSIASAVGLALEASDDQKAQKLGQRLMQPDRDDLSRLALIQQALTEEPVLLVLDDFEQNLITGGDAFLDPTVSEQLQQLVGAARRGRLLITCRYPIPGAASFLQQIEIRPLSPAESRKLLLRLDGLRRLDDAALRDALRLLGGHPRMMELFDGLLCGGKGRLPHVTQKLQALLQEQQNESPTQEPPTEHLQLALTLGARDICLVELFAIAERKQIAEALLQISVSNLPVTADGLARMLAPAPAEAGDAASAERAIGALADLSLVHRDPDGAAWVHRWTAEGLAGLVDATAQRERARRAGEYRRWRAANESHEIADLVANLYEATRNFLDAEAFDVAAATSLFCCKTLRRLQRSISIAALASEVLERLPEDHAAFARVADEAGRALRALGQTGAALRRYQALRARQERLAQAEPDRADYQHDLSVTYNRMGDILRDLGQGEQARSFFEKALAIAEPLAQAEPDRADYQRDLSVSYNHMGDLLRALGQGEEARAYFEKQFAIAERLAQAEPDRADYQRDLAVSYIKMGDMLRALGQGKQARVFFKKSLAIHERLVQAEPDRADYQRDLSVSYNKMGALLLALGQCEDARVYFEKQFAIAERLVQAEPDRADYQRDLMVSCVKMSAAEPAAARGYLQRALAIVRALKDSGRLAPRDAWMEAALQRRLGELE